MSAAVARRAFFAARAHRGAAIGRDVSGTRAEEDDEEGTQGTRPRARGGMLEDVVLATREGAGGGEGSEEEGKEEGKEEAAALVSLAAAGPWIVAADAAGDAWAWDASARGERFEREVRENETGGARPLRGAKDSRSLRLRLPSQRLTPPPSDARPGREDLARPGREDLLRTRRPFRPTLVAGAPRGVPLASARRVTSSSRSSDGKKKSNGRGLGSGVFFPPEPFEAAAPTVVVVRGASVEVRRAIAVEAELRGMLAAARGSPSPVSKLRAAVALARAASEDGVGTATAESPDPGSVDVLAAVEAAAGHAAMRELAFAFAAERLAAAADLVDRSRSPRASRRSDRTLFWGSEAPKKKPPRRAGRFEASRTRTLCSGRRGRCTGGRTRRRRTSRKSSPRRSGGGRRRRGGGTRGGRPPSAPKRSRRPPRKIRLGSKNRFRASPSSSWTRSAPRAVTSRRAFRSRFPPGTRVSADWRRFSRASARRPARRARWRRRWRTTRRTTSTPPSRYYATRAGVASRTPPSPRGATRRRRWTSGRRSRGARRWRRRTSDPSRLGPPGGAASGDGAFGDVISPGTVFRDGALSRGRGGRGYPEGTIVTNGSGARALAGRNSRASRRSGAARRSRRRGARRRRSRTGSGRSTRLRCFGAASSTGRVDFSEDGDGGGDGDGGDGDGGGRRRRSARRRLARYRPREPRRARGETRPLDPRRGRGFGEASSRRPLPARDGAERALRLLRAGGARPRLVAATSSAASRRAARGGATRGRTPSSRSRSSRRRSGNSSRRANLDPKRARTSPKRRRWISRWISRGCRLPTSSPPPRTRP